MPPVRASNRGDPARVPRCGQPVVNRRSNLAPLDRRLAGASVAGDQQDKPVAPRNPLLETAIDCPPRTLEVHAVQVDYAVRFDRTVAETPVPACIEGLARLGAGRLHGLGRKLPRRRDPLRDPCSFRRFFRISVLALLTG